MYDRIPRVFKSLPLLVAGGVFVFYLLAGFFALPAILKWQIEKQVPAQLGHGMTVGALRFNPLSLALEADDVLLSDAAGAPLLGFRHLRIDLEWRGLIDRAWSFSLLSVEGLALDLARDPGGRYNFAGLIDRLRDADSEPDPALPRLQIKRLRLAQARLSYSDALLTEPVVAWLEPLDIEVADLSTLAGRTARYQMSARSTVKYKNLKKTCSKCL